MLRRADGRVVARSTALSGAVDVAAAGSADLAGFEPAWGRTVAATLAVLARRGREPVGFDATISSTLPIGAGLSSSAALGVALALAAAAVGALDLAPTDLALVAQEAEQLASGVPCGVLDQLASVRGLAGHALLLDCRTLGTEPVAIPPAVEVLVVHSGLERRLAGSAYAQRRAAVRSGRGPARTAGPARRGDRAGRRRSDRAPRRDGERPRRRVRACVAERRHRGVRRADGREPPVAP